MVTRTESRVVPAIGVTIATSSPARRLSRLDFPTFGRPMRTAVRPSRSTAPCRASPSTPSSCAPIVSILRRIAEHALERRPDPIELAPRRLAIGRVDLFLGEIDARLDVRAQVREAGHDL